MGGGRVGERRRGGVRFLGKGPKPEGNLRPSKMVMEVQDKFVFIFIFIFIFFFFFFFFFFCWAIVFGMFCFLLRS